MIPEISEERMKDYGTWAQSPEPKADLVCTKDKIGFPSCQIMTEEGDTLSAETFDFPVSLEGIREAVERIEFWDKKGYDTEPAKDSLRKIIKNEF